MNLSFGDSSFCMYQRPLSYFSIRIYKCPQTSRDISLFLFSAIYSIMKENQSVNYRYLCMRGGHLHDNGKEIFGRIEGT